MLLKPKKKDAVNNQLSKQRNALASFMTGENVVKPTTLLRTDVLQKFMSTVPMKEL